LLLLPTPLPPPSSPLTRPPPASPLFPYTTLFRSRHHKGCPAHALDAAGDHQVRLTRLDGTRGSDDGIHAGPAEPVDRGPGHRGRDRKSTRLNSSHVKISYAVFCLKKKNN